MSLFLVASNVFWHALTVAIAHYYLFMAYNNYAALFKAWRSSFYSWLQTLEAAVMFVAGLASVAVSYYYNLSPAACLCTHALGFFVAYVHGLYYDNGYRYISPDELIKDMCLFVAFVIFAYCAQAVYLSCLASGNLSYSEQIRNSVLATAIRQTFPVVYYGYLEFQRLVVRVFLLPINQIRKGREMYRRLVALWHLDFRNKWLKRHAQTSYLRNDFWRCEIYSYTHKYDKILTWNPGKYNSKWKYYDLSNWSHPRGDDKKGTWSVLLSQAGKDALLAICTDFMWSPV